VYNEFNQNEVVKMKDFVHIPVMLKEAMTSLNVKPDGLYVDCTLGGAGHSQEILKKLTTGHLYAFDQDLEAINASLVRLSAISDRFTLIHANFSDLKACLVERGIREVDGILFDLGVSSYQFDTPERGFSYQFDHYLDMRMNQEQTLDAYQVVNTYPESALRRIFFEYGEENFAPQIARMIVKARAEKPIETTFQLVEIIKKALPAAVLRKPQHPAKKTFQALRIEVNQELAVLEKALEDALSLLKIGGVCVVITFHSLDDRIVKQLFKNKTTLSLPKGLPFVPAGYEVHFQLVHKKALTPTEEELALNRRSHSAKLRAIKRIS
jgi:16S rRNA (cytosine1402-N4)-methyltransferase